MLKDHQIKILMLAHDVEKTLSEIYTLFAGHFPEHRDLWDVLIREEHEHADAVRKLYQLTYEDKSTFDEGKIKVEGIQSIIDYLEGIREAARQGKFAATRALAIACDIERSLIERDFYSHFTVSPQYSDILQILVNGAKTHAKLVQKRMAR
jgi:rubrerythrin